MTKSIHIIFYIHEINEIECSRQYTVDYKLETYLKIARLYLEDDDPVQAEAFINRASLLQVISLIDVLSISFIFSKFLILLFPTG